MDNTDSEDDLYNSTLETKIIKNNKGQKSNDRSSLFKRSDRKTESATPRSPLSTSSHRRLPSSSSKFTKSGRTLRTVLIYCAFLGLGLCIALPGPTLLDLEARTKSTTDQMSYLFVGRSVGYLIGSLIGGLLYDRFNQMLLLGLSLLLTGAATLIFPMAVTLFFAIVLIGCQGFSMGMLDTGGNVLCIRIWGRSSESYLQGLHFAFGVGAFLAPLIAEPFLSKVAATPVAPALFVNNDLGGAVTSPATLLMLSRNKRYAEDDFIIQSTVISGGNNPKHFDAYRVGGDSDASFFSSTNNNDRRSPVPVQRSSVFGRGSNRRTLLSTRSSWSVPKHEKVKNKFVPSAKSSTLKSTTTTATTGSSTSTAEATTTPSSLPELLPLTSTTNSSAPKKPTINEGEKLPDKSASAAEGSKGANQLTKDALKGEGVVPPLAPADSKQTFSSPDPLSVVSPIVGKDANDTTNNETLTDSVTPSQDGSGIILSSAATPSIDEIVTNNKLISNTVSTTTTTTTTATTSTTTTLTTTSSTTTLAISSKATNFFVIEHETTDASIFPGDNVALSTKGTPNKEAQNITTTTTLEMPTTIVSTTSSLEAQQQKIAKLSHIQIAYTIVSIFLGLVSVLFLLIGCAERLQLPCAGRMPLIEVASESGLYRLQAADSVSLGESTASEGVRSPRSGGGGDGGQSSVCPSGFHIQLLVLLFIFYMIYVGGEVAFGQFISAYAERAQQWSRQDAAYLASAFWGALAVGRGAAIYLTRHLRPASMIALNLTLLTVAMLGMLIGVQSFDTALWLCAALAGAGMSSIFASGFSWTERYIKVTGKISSVLVAGSAIGEMVLPVLAGFFFVRNPQSLAYLMSAVALLLAVIFALLQNMALNSLDRFRSHDKTVSNTSFNGNDDEEETFAGNHHDEAVRLLPMGSANGRAFASSIDEDSASSRYQPGESEEKRSKTTLLQVFDENGNVERSSGGSSRKVISTPVSSAVLIGDDGDGEDEDNENFFDAFTVGEKNATTTASNSGNNNNNSGKVGSFKVGGDDSVGGGNEMLLLDRRNLSKFDNSPVSVRTGDENAAYFSSSNSPSSWSSIGGGPNSTSSNNRQNLLI